jgi:ribonuclease P protein component
MRNFATLRGREIAAVRRRGRRFSRPTITVYCVETGPKSRPAAAVSVDTRVGKAVVRNLVRRRILAVLQSLLGMRQGWRVLIVARPASANAGFQALRTDVESALGTV